MEWKYVGEAGLELKARNSHSLGIVTSTSSFSSGSNIPCTDGDNITQSLSMVTESYLVLYGGASPEEGPMGDTVYARLPCHADIDIESFFVTWLALSIHTTVTARISDSDSSPGPREMHSTCNHMGQLIIAGGRNEKGEVLSDVWILKSSHNSFYSQNKNESNSSNCNFSSNDIKEREVSIPIDSCSSSLQTGKINILVGDIDPSPSISLTSSSLFPSLNVPLSEEEVRKGIQEISLSGVRTIQYNDNNEKNTAATATNSIEIAMSSPVLPPPLLWSRQADLQLPVGRCAHSSAVIGNHISIYGGFTSEEGITDSFILARLPPSFEKSITSHAAPTSLSTINKEAFREGWNVTPLQSSLENNKNRNISKSQSSLVLGCRFGHTMCSTTASLTFNLLQINRKQTIQKDSDKEEIEKTNIGGGGLLVFGGVDEIRDFNDVWFINSS